MNKEELLKAIATIRTHYYRCISTSRKDESSVDVQNAKRVINEASFEESETVLKALETLEKLI